MNKANAANGKFEYLSELLLGSRQEQYSGAYWLESDFSAEVWRGNFRDGGCIEIDFRVLLDDGKSLTACEHNKLLKNFKQWICIQTHFDATGGLPLNGATARHRVDKTLHLIDYLLLNAADFQLAKYGLQTITKNDLTGLLIKVSESNLVSHSIYEWPKRLTLFLQSKIEVLTDKEKSLILSDFPYRDESIPEKDDQLTYLSDEEIRLARAWLWKYKLYNRGKDSTFKFRPNIAQLSKTLYSNTLRGKTSFKYIPIELGLVPDYKYIREYHPVPVRNDIFGRLSEKALAQYKNSLRLLGLLGEIETTIPISSLKVIDDNAVSQVLNAKTTGRFRTLPNRLVLDCLKNAIEFSLEYGDDIIQSYLNVLHASLNENLDCTSYSQKFSISIHLTQRIKELGVSQWTIGPMHGFGQEGARIEKETYFSKLRRKDGLWELLQVLQGCIQVTVGTLMARRQAELLDLVAGKCLDSSQTRLIFFNRKSGIEDMREKEARPIPPVAVTLIKKLEKLQSKLIHLNVIEKHVSLFSMVGRLGNSLTKASAQSFNTAIDIFCDYFETPLDNGGLRFYIRQHQLRRFFPMLFFWSASFNGMETLRWFLGHSDVEHLYRYITEATPGEILRSVKANYALACAKENLKETEALADLLEQHFKTRNFSVLDSDELESYIEDLLIEGVLKIEPEFFDTTEGKRYRILIKILPL